MIFFCNLCVFVCFVGDFLGKNITEVCLGFCCVCLWCFFNIGIKKRSLLGKSLLNNLIVN